MTPRIEAIPKSLWVSPIKGDVPIDHRAWFVSLRPCPSCRRSLATNGRGLFRCPECGFSDRQELPRQRSARRKKDPL